MWRNKAILGLCIVGIFLLTTSYFFGQKSEKSLNKSHVLPTNTTLLTPSTTSYPTQVLGTQAESYRVVKIIDGDTLDIEINGVKETVRLIGIDTPETVDPRKPVQCFGKEASSYARNLLNGKLVQLEEDETQGNRDKYRRLLRYIFLEDGTHVNKIMIEQGYAHEYTYQTSYKYQLAFKEAERQARQNKQGLWADDVCITTPTLSQAMPSITGNYACSCSKSCSEIKTCEEAYFQLNTCGCKIRDSDSDGVPCESLCR